jgi:hypothetical protein
MEPKCSTQGRRGAKNKNVNFKHRDVWRTMTEMFRDVASSFMYSARLPVTGVAEGNFEQKIIL